MLKVFEKAVEGKDATTYLFHFNTSEARAEAKSVKDLLSRLLSDLRSNDAGVPKPATDTPNSNGASTPAAAGSGSSSMAFATAVNAPPSSLKWFDDTHLKNDIELQQSLMKKDKSLHQTYMEAMSTKPDSISGAAFNTQFWSTRINLLRAHAIESNQKKGAYNVLSTVKPKTVDGELKLNISVEQVQMILTQHPLIKRIYNENVPRVSENSFWARFFLSKLAKKLRGEVVTDSDAPDPLFDKYDPSENTEAFQSRIMAQQSVPHIIDIEANEENQGGVKSGNAKDFENRQRTSRPIVKTLNSLSEKIMANVAPSDAALDDQAGGTTYDTYNELALRDLRGDAKEHRIMLNVKEQNQFFSKKEEREPSANAKIFATQKPSEVLFDITADIETLEPDGVGGIDLQAGLGYDEDSDSEEEDATAGTNGTAKRAHVGSRASIMAAEADIMHGIHQRRSQRYGTSTSSSSSSSPLDGTTLPEHIVSRVSLTHATTTEFLHQFWSAFLSGDPDRAAELQYLAESLARSLERVAAVAEEAERDRLDTVRKRKAEIKEHYERTGKKIRWRSEMAGGGREEVERLMAPVVKALEKARQDYSRALAAEGLKPSTEG